MGLFGTRKPKAQPTAAPASLAEVMRTPPSIELLSMRNPPMAGGVPFFDPDDLLRLHNDLLLQIRIATGASDEDFARYYMTAARSFAAFVHALPASRAHHHRGAGGMLRHGFEVAFYALRHIEGQFFSRVGTPEERRNDEPRWRLATFLAALNHDLGKVVCDISVYDSTKRRKWVPFAESLSDWGARHNLDVYHPQWNETREYHSHEPVSAICVDMIVTADHRAYICEGAPIIMSSMMMAIIGNKAMSKNLILDAVARADSDSTSASLKASATVVDGIQTTDTPAEAMLSVAHRLALEAWIPNNPGSKAVVTEDAVYLIWPAAHDDIRLRAKSEGVQSIVPEAEVAAEAFVKSSLAIPYLRAGATPLNLWRIVPKFPQAAGTMPRWALKLPRSSGLYDGFKGPYIECQVVEPSVTRADQSAFVEPSADDARQPDNDTEGIDPASADMPDGGAQQDVPPPDQESPSGSSRPKQRHQKPSEPKPETSEGASPGSTPAPVKPSSQPQKDAATKTPRPDSASETWFRKLGETGILLQNMLDRATSTNTQLELVPFNGSPCLIFDTQALEGLLGIPIKDLAAMLDDARLIQRDDKTPTLFTVAHPKKPKLRVLAFTSRATAMLVPGTKHAVQPVSQEASEEPAVDPMHVPPAATVKAPKYPEVLNERALKVLVADAQAGAAGFSISGDQLYANLNAIVGAVTAKIPNATKANIKDWCYCAGTRVLKPRLIELNLPSLAPAYSFTIQTGGQHE